MAQEYRFSFVVHLLQQVEQIPATVCAHCGEPVFSRDTTERVRRMVHSEAQSIKSIQMDAFAYR
jgi:YgiT-type zinc finger domain-containing protein